MTTESEQERQRQEQEQQRQAQQQQAQLQAQAAAKAQPKTVATAQPKTVATAQPKTVAAAETVTIVKVQPLGKDSSDREASREAKEQRWIKESAIYEQLEQSGVLKDEKERERAWATGTTIAETKALAQEAGKEQAREWATQSAILETKALAEVDKQLEDETEMVKQWAREDVRYAINVLKDKYNEAIADPLKERAGIASSVWQGLTPWKEEEGEKATKGRVALMAAELVVPGVYLKNRWGELSTGEKAAFIAIDIICVVPIIAALARGARTVGVAGRTARMAAAAKEAGREAALLVTAPIDMLIHPYGTAKSAAKEVRNLVENIAHPRKLPEAVITTSEGTVRLKVSETTSPQEAQAIRDQLMELAMRGERPVIEIGGTRVELARSPLMRELKGGATHATPTGDVFEGGLKVSPKPGMAPAEQGLFLSHEPLPRFAEASAFGKAGEKPTIIITSRETAMKSISTGKIYDSPVGKVAEMERKFPVGFEVPEANQKLFTRIGVNGQKVEILLEKPLSARQIAKLKLEGLVETIKAPFKPAIQISGERLAGLTEKEVKTLSRILERSGNVDQARNLLRAARLARASRAAAPAFGRVVGITGISARRPQGERLQVERPELAGRLERPERQRIETERLELRRLERRELSRLERERPELSRPERVRLSRERVRTERERIERERPERERVERERAERERVERERPELSRIERERLVRERLERERPERERLERERPPRERPPRERPPRVPPERPPRVPPEKPPRIPPSSATDEEERELIRQSVGAVAWNMGKLGRKNPQDIWHVRLPDGKHIILRGAPPQGARILADGPGSASKTTQAIGGRLRRAIMQQHGAVKAIITPSRRSSGAEARFAPSGLKSVKKGRQYFTKMGGGVAISRRPLGRRHKR